MASDAGRGTMPERQPSILQYSVLAAALKLLLFPAYKSTDFEVHRNWLAITHSLPVKQWYFESSSEWTLDYPPLFAYFEWLLSLLARPMDRAMLVVGNLNYDSWATVAFQRSTVILTELVLAYALHVFVQASPDRSKPQARAAALSVLLSPGLLIIDHIHFQYNGMMYGLLILSLVAARHPASLLRSGVLFAALLCFKHIFLYLAPAYFVYLLRVYCLGSRSVYRVRVANCLQLGAALLLVFGTVFGPFVYWGQLDQLRKRLFPFSRGLCHAYWAPNAWALYSFADRVLLTAAPRLGLRVNKAALHSVTRGLVGDTSFAVLPEVTPAVTFQLTLAAQSLGLLKLLRRPTWKHFVGAVTLCGYGAFLFGWHVHEKAVLLALVPFSLLALDDRRYLGAFRPLAVAGHVALFPLLHARAEFLLKVGYTVLWLNVFLVAFDKLAPASPRPRVFLLDRFALLYTAVAIPLVLYCSLVHGLVFAGRFEFLPLMFVSAYSAVGVVGSWTGFLVVFLSD